jgi:hypothetical protein
MKLLRPRAASLEGGWRVARASQLHQRRNPSINSVIYPRARRLSKDVSVSPVLIRVRRLLRPGRLTPPDGSTSACARCGSTSARVPRKQTKVNESKNAFIYFRLFFGIWTFQRVTAEKNKKIFLLLHCLRGCAAERLKRSFPCLSPSESQAAKPSRSSLRRLGRA